MTARLHDASRREFLKSGSALVVGIALAPETALAQAAAPAPLPGSLNGNRMLSSWLRINPNGTVTVFTGKIELGQGIATALAQIAADELDVDYRRIEMVTGDTSRTPNEGVTAGSQSVEQSGAAVRFACAEARELLLGAAAAKLGVAPADLKVADGTIAAPGGKQATYWEVTSDAMLRREATAKAKPKAPGEYKYVGQSLSRRDIPPKFTGGAAYVQDLRLPGMLHARVVRPPAPRAELVSLDAGAVKAIPGVVTVVRDGNFLAVVCEREEQAIKAREALRAAAVWMRPDLPLTLADTFDRPEPGLPSRDSVVNEKTGVGRAARREANRGALYPRLSAARFHRAVVCGRAKRRRQAHGLDPQPGRLSAARRHGARARRRAGEHHLRPHGRFGLLRPERRGRRRVRRGARRARGARQAGPAAVDARRRVHVGAVRLGDDHEDGRRARRGGPHRRLAARAVELSAHDAARQRPRGREPAGGVVRGEADAPNLPQRRAAAGRRLRPELDPTLRLPEPADRQALHAGRPAADLGAADARRLRERVRARIVHGRGRGGGRRRSHCVPAAALARRTRAGGDRDGGAEEWLARRRARRSWHRRHPARARDRLLRSTRTSPATAPSSPTSRSTARAGSCA